jgi:hypothetical protein
MEGHTASPHLLCQSRRATVISCNQWQSVVIRGHQWQSHLASS